MRSNRSRGDRSHPVQHRPAVGSLLDLLDRSRRNPVKGTPHRILTGDDHPVVVAYRLAGPAPAAGACGGQGGTPTARGSGGSTPSRGLVHASTGRKRAQATARVVGRTEAAARGGTGRGRGLHGPGRGRRAVRGGISTGRVPQPAELRAAPAARLGPVAGRAHHDRGRRLRRAARLVRPLAGERGGQPRLLSGSARAAGSRSRRSGSDPRGRPGLARGRHGRAARARRRKRPERPHHGLTRQRIPLTSRTPGLILRVETARGIQSGRPRAPHSRRGLKQSLGT